MTSKETARPGTRVLLIAPQPFYEERGTPMNVRLMCTVLGNAGYQVDLLVLPTGRDVAMAGVRVIRLPNLFGVRHIPIGFSIKKLAFDLLLPFRAGWLCLRHRYRVIHGVEEGGVLAIVLGLVFRVRGRIYDMDSVLSEQFGKYGRGKARLILRLVQMMEKWSIRHASVVLTVCQSLSEAARELEPRANIVQVEDIPLSSQYPISRQDRDRAGSEVRRLVSRHGLDQKRIMLYTGNLESYQGIDLLLDAWCKVVDNIERADSCRLVIVGGPEGLVRTYSRRVKRFPWGKSVCFVGPRPAREMDCWMDIAHALVSPRSQGANTPLKIYTYMASGKPIVATRMMTHTQVLSDDVAFLVEPEATSMANAIQHVIENQDQARIRAEAARDLVQRKYSYQVFEEKLLHAYTLAGERRQKS